MRLFATLACALLLLSACTSGDGTASAQPEAEITFDSLELDWAAATDRIATVDPPEVPEGFNETRFDRMVDALNTWAVATTLESDVRESDDPAKAVGATLPKAVSSQVSKLGKGSVSPRLAAANVFADDVTVLGKPRVTTAWSAETTESDGEPALSLKLQTRAAYEVRIEDGPTRVIGVLRVHELITREGETGPVGVGFGWQEFGASDCTLAIDDALRPDGDVGPAEEDLRTFIDVGSGGTVEMPDLESDDTVDKQYLDRCKRGQV